MARRGWGEGKITKCVFCENASTKLNNLNWPVCHRHYEEQFMPVWMCACGRELGEPIKGKFGVFFSCICGNINFEKAREMNNLKGKFKIQKRK